MKKIILYLFLCLMLVACTNSKYEEKGTVDATVRIAYNTDDKVIKVSNVIIKCNITVGTIRKRGYFFAGTISFVN